MSQEKKADEFDLLSERIHHQLTSALINIDHAMAYIDRAAKLLEGEIVKPKRRGRPPGSKNIKKWTNQL